jgi:hypothetical protein
LWSLDPIAWIDFADFDILVLGCLIRHVSLLFQKK